MKFFLDIIFNILAKGIAYFPRKLQMLLGKILGTFFYDILKIRKKVLDQNLFLVFPNMSHTERRTLARKCMRNLGQSAIEYANLFHPRSTWFQTFVSGQGEEYITEGLKKRKGVFILASHMGSGDYLGYWLAQKFPTYLISKKFKNKWLNEIWFKIRSQQGIRFIEDKNSTFDILRALKKNGVIIFILDQFAHPPYGIKTQFFGHPTGTTMGLATFALKTGAAVFPGYNIRQKNGVLLNIIEPEIPFESKGDRKSSVGHMTQVYTDKIEEIIRNNPTQWMWTHRRWKPFVET